MFTDIPEYYTWFKPTAELNADNFFGTKEQRISSDGTPINSKEGVISMYVGPSFHVARRFIIAATCGPSFYNRKLQVGIRPSIGFYPLNNKKMDAENYFYKHLSERQFSKERFGYYSFALAFKVH